MRDQLLAVAGWLRGRYESAPAVELPLLCAVIGYLEALAECEPAGEPSTAAGEAPAEGPAPHAAVAAPDPERPFPERLGTFRETLLGGVVTPDDGESITIPYSVVHAAHMRHGDRVRLSPKPGEPGKSFFTPTGESIALGDSGVREVLAVVQRRGGDLVAALDGRSVPVRRGHPHVPPPAPGDVVTVRYAPDRGSGAAYVVRVHEQPAVESDRGLEAARTRRVRRRARATGERERLPPAPPSAATPAGSRAPVAPPRELPTILVVGGHDRNRSHYRAVLAACAHVEWQAGNRLTKSLRARVSAARAIVLVIQHMPHTVSEYVLGEVRRNGTPYVMAQSENATGLARQVQRELLPVLLEKPPAHDVTVDQHGAEV